VCVCVCVCVLAPALAGSVRLHAVESSRCKQNVGNGYRALIQLVLWVMTVVGSLKICDVVKGRTTAPNLIKQAVGGRPPHYVPAPTSTDSGSLWAVA